MTASPVVDQVKKPIITGPTTTSTRRKLQTGEPATKMGFGKVQPYRTVPYRTKTV